MQGKGNEGRKEGRKKRREEGRKLYIMTILLEKLLSHG
jgi:hypothetical protein